MPKRIQRKRTKGWQMPVGAVYVGRPTKWGNPFKAGAEYMTVAAGGMLCTDAADAVRLYKPCALTRREEITSELRGKDLACWCPLDQPCHADVLLELANK